MSLPQPKGDQIKVLCLPEVGHYVVLGTAGSGKTTLAIQRAAYLAKRTMMLVYNYGHKIRFSVY